MTIKNEAKWINKKCENCGYKIETTEKDYQENGCRNCGHIEIIN